MTAHHIRQRQIQEEAAKINRAYAAAAVTAPELLTTEQREAMKNRALEVLFTDAAPPYVYPYDAHPAGIDSIKTRAISEAAEAQELHVMINGLFQELNKYGFDVPETRLVAKGYLQLCDAVGYLPEGEVFAEAYADEVRDQRRDEDPLAGLGLRAGDLEAVRDQLLGLFGPLQREFYRAQFMAAAIQGSIVDYTASAHDEGILLDRAKSIADGALIRMGL